MRIVCPASTETDSHFDGLVENEIKRALEFAKTARNSNSAESELRKLLILIGSDPEQLLNEIDENYEHEQ